MLSRYSFVFWFSMLLLMTSSLKRGPKYSRLWSATVRGQYLRPCRRYGEENALVVVRQVLVELLAEDDTRLVCPCSGNVLQRQREWNSVLQVRNDWAINLD